MTSELVEFLLGIYFIVLAGSVTKTGATYSRGIDIYKFIAGIILIVLALLQGVRFI